jgi:dTDP-glucose 4,6-dehydratase
VEVKNPAKGRFNIVGEKEVDNLTLAKFISDVIKKPLIYELVDFHSSRPGHDLRYGLDGTKLKELGFSFPVTFEESLTKTINWSLENRDWL